MPGFVEVDNPLTEGRTEDRDLPRAVIFTAIPVEYKAVRDHLEHLEEKEHPCGTIYEQGIFSSNGREWNVGIVETGPGNEQAALEVERAIQYFNPNIIFFVGVAGGVKDVKLGDVAVASKVYGYESGKAGDNFYPRPEAFTPDYKLISRAKAEARKDDWLQRLGAPVPDPHPSVFVKPIAAGAKVLNSTRSEVYNFIKSNYGDTLAVEMEGYGFFRAAHANSHVGALVIRGISDLISKKEKADKAGFQEIASLHASAFAFEILAKTYIEPDGSKKQKTLEKTYVLDKMIRNTEANKLSAELYLSRTFSSFSTGMEFVLIPAGEFMMGSPDSEVGRYDSEGPTHKVTIKTSFYIGKYPVTQRQWKNIMGNNPSRFKGDDRPVEYVSWDDAKEFIKKLNETEGTDKYRLPFEAEWEYACRAGTTTRFYFGDDDSNLNDYAWYNVNSGNETSSVGQKKPNPWGLYDMHGNIWEWVQDRWHDNYKGAPSDGSSWEDLSSRVSRGGGWRDSAASCRSAVRYDRAPGNRVTHLGFRLMREL